MTLQEGFSGFSGSNRRNPDGAEWRVCLSEPQGAPVCPASPVSPVFPGCLDQMPEFTTTAIICRIVYALWVVGCDLSIRHHATCRTNRTNRKNLCPRATADGCHPSGRGAPIRYPPARRAPARAARYGRRDEAHGPGYRACRGRTGGCRMTSHREPSRDRHHQSGPIDAETEKRAGGREHGILVVAEQDPRLSRSERTLVAQLGAKLYGQRRDMKR
jgi:hypothetical protein